MDDPGVARSCLGGRRAGDRPQVLDAAVLDAVRLGPDDDEMAVTAAQVRDVIIRLIAAGQWRDGDAQILVVFDAGYDVTRLAFVLAGPARPGAGPGCAATG